MGRGWRAWLNRLVLGLTLLGLGGCSLIETGYNQSPMLLQWWLDRQFDLDHEQEQALRAELRGLQAWHRQNQLPLVSRSVLGLIEWTGIDLSSSQSCAFQAEVLQSLQVLGLQASTRLARPALSLRAEQIVHLRRHFEEDNVKWREEWLEGSDEDRLQRRYKRALERIEDYYGRLDKDQKQLLRQTLSESPYHPPTAWAERQRRQRDVADTLDRLRQSQAGVEQSQQALADLVARMLNPPVEAHRQHVSRNTDFICAATARMHNAMRADQRDRARAKLVQQQQALARLVASSN